VLLCNSPRESDADDPYKSITNPHFSDGFVAKISAQGSLTWLQRWGGGSYDAATSVAVDETSGAAYVAGEFRSYNCQFGTEPSAPLVRATTSQASYVFSEEFGRVMLRRDTDAYVAKVCESVLPV
jgi:hypothetical protein